MTDEDVAAAYSRDVHAAERAGVDAEPEAQLTTPVKQLFERLAERARLPRLDLLREAQLPGIRPDFSSLVGGRAGGWVELKEPAKTVDGRRWTGREKKQWEGLSELDTLIVCNGREAQLFGLGEPDGAPAGLPYDGAGGWDPAPLTGLLRRFVESQPRTVRRVSDLALRLAPLTRFCGNGCAQPWMPRRPPKRRAMPRPRGQATFTRASTTPHSATTWHR